MVAAANQHRSRWMFGGVEPLAGERERSKIYVVNGSIRAIICTSGIDHGI